MSCGHPAIPNTTIDTARLTRLAAATPATLATKMRAVRVTSARKVVTILFADIVGSMALAERMDAEDWKAIMDEAFDRLARAIYRYEGTIAQLLGDGLLAFFGAPVAHEDDPMRGVRAALDLLAAAREFADKVRGTHGIEFAIRVGLNTGPVVVGPVGTDLKYDYLATGDAVNLAARMQTAARPMTVLISSGTHRFVAAAFDCADLGLIEVKGKTEPVHVYEVRGSKTQAGLIRARAGLESPMVGRETELAALLQLCMAVCAGKGHVALIVGEPGIGKSRLMAEWKAAAARVPSGRTPGETFLRWAEGQCLSYGQGMAYHLLIDLLRSLIGVAAAASEPETRAALLEFTRDLFGDSAPNVYPYLGHLLSVRLDDAALERVRPLQPQALQAKTLGALRKLLLAAAARRPLVLMLSDIHWADPSSTDLLIKLLPLAAEASVCFCIVTRPDQDAPGWRLIAAARDYAGSNLTELTLNPLSDTESRRLASHLLKTEALQDHVAALVLQRAEGNPLFVEELTRTLIDHSAIVKAGEQWAIGDDLAAVEIPDTLQGLLVARIDRLPDDIKRTLCVASVIGRQFSVPLLEQMLAMEGDA